jgi:hypothetical protein
MRPWQIIVAFLFISVVGGGCYIYRATEPNRRSRAVWALIVSLQDRRPPEITRGQWGSAVAWTRNLHANSLLMFEADAPTIAAFERRLRKRLEERVDMRTIDWIWAEYANLCPHGASYQRFKEQMLDEIERVGSDSDSWGMNVR